MGQNPTEEEIFQMISQVDDDNSGEIELSDETDTIEAFVALGGNADKTGEISTEQLRAVVKVRLFDTTFPPVRVMPMRSVHIKSLHNLKPRSFFFLLQDFGLTIDIDKLIRETDADGSGQVDYPEFKAMMA